MFKSLTRATLATTAALLVTWQALPAAAQPLATHEIFAYAVQQFDAGRYAAAYGRFMWLANRGHAEAARFALDMHRFGGALYGSDFDAAPHQVRDWVAAASIERSSRLALAR